MKDTMQDPLGVILAGGRLPALDGVRALAVLTVIVGHQWHTVPADLGVSAFFVMSGFLITWLLLREHERTGSISLRQFYGRRTLRIFPAYYAFLAVSLSADWLFGDARLWNNIWWALLYVMNYFNALHGHPATSAAHAWSLAIEEQFYLIWPAIVLACLLVGRRRLLHVGLLLICGVMLWRCLAWYVLDFPVAWIYNAFDTRFDNLLVGCVLAAVVLNPAARLRCESLSSRAWAPLVTIVLLLVSRLAAPAGPWHYGPGFTVDAVLMAILLVQFMLLAESRAWRWLEHPATRYLGTISYPMYLYHGWGAAVGDEITILPALGRFAAGLVATTLLASGSYWVIEKPFLRLKPRLRGGGPLPNPHAVQPSP